MSERGSEQSLDVLKAELTALIASYKEDLEKDLDVQDAGGVDALLHNAKGIEMLASRITSLQGFDQKTVDRLRAIGTLFDVAEVAEEQARKARVKTAEQSVRGGKNVEALQKKGEMKDSLGKLFAEAGDLGGAVTLNDIMNDDFDHIQAVIDSYSGSPDKWPLRDKMQKLLDAIREEGV